VTNSSSRPPSPISAHDWQKAFRLLDTALDLPVAEHETWLDQLDEENTYLKPVLRDLLRQRSNLLTDDFLDSLPKFTKLNDELKSGNDLLARKRESRPGAPGPGAMTGPYRLINEIGVGGMGSVWLAERADGTLKRKVALKLPRMSWSQDLTERMARERDILAALEHPNVARLYDAGFDSFDRPYLALEYVEGKPIDIYCREHALPLPGCIALLLQVASAVAYAHARLIVHRDLKPSNILVTPDGQVKLLDFGIAKLLDAELDVDPATGLTTVPPMADGGGEANIVASAADDVQPTSPINKAPASPLTEVGTRALTADYASPEQIFGEPVGTGSDVYSLGVVAYEVLAATRPYTLTRGSRKLAAIERAMTQLEVPLASDQASNLQLKKSLKGDLDAILQMALKKRVAERYATVDALGDDLKRYLQNEPVRARPDSGGYRLRKFVTRYKVPVAAGAAVLVAVLGGASVALWQAKKSQESAARADAVRNFLVASLRDQGASVSADLTPSLVNARLISSAAKIESSFKDSPALRQELYGVVANIFADLDLSPLAVEYGAKHLALAQTQAKSQISAPKNAANSAALAEAAVPLARGYMREGKPAQAESTLRENFSDGVCSTPRTCLAYIDALLRLNKIAEADRQMQVFDSLLAADPGLDVGFKIDAEGLKGRIATFQRSPTALTHYERAIEWARAEEGESSTRVATLRYSYGVRLSETWNRPKAWEQYRAAGDAFRSLGGEFDLNAAEVDLDFGFYLALETSGRRVEGLARLERARDVFNRNAFSARAERLGRSNAYLGVVHKSSGDFSQAYAAMRAEGDPSVATKAGKSEGFRYWYRREYADLLSVQGNEAAGREILLVLIADMAATEVRKNWSYPAAKTQLARTELYAGNLEAAEMALTDALTFVPQAYEHYPATRDRAEWVRGQILLARGEYAKAQTLFERAVGLLAAEQIDNRTDRDEAFLRAALGEALCGSAQNGGADKNKGIATLREAEKLHALRQIDSSPLLARTRAVLAGCLAAAGQAVEAKQAAALADRAFRAQPGISGYFKQPWLSLPPSVRSALPEVNIKVNSKANIEANVKKG
jgi:eukaryotic-like serine/threonine-protein kinase